MGMASLTDAKSAHDRVLGMLNKCFAAVAAAKDPELTQRFKETMTSLQGNSQLLSNALMFKDCCPAVF